MPPPIVFGGRRWESRELAAMAAGWIPVADAGFRSEAELAAVVLANHPVAIALFFALSALRRPLIVLAPEPRSWRSEPPIPAGTPLFLAPGQHGLAEAAAGLGLRPQLVPEPDRASRAVGAGPMMFLQTPGLVSFSSGSTGPPKPVYNATHSLLRQVTVMAETYGLSDKTSVAGSLPLASHFGLGHSLLLPTWLGAQLGLLPQFNPRALLTLLASGPYDYWAGTPLMADLLARAPLAGPPPPVPALCHISAGPLPESVSRAFRDRFGVPLRPSYGRTECGFITAETAGADRVRPAAVGRPSPGIEICIGDDPRLPLPAGTLGRVWFSSPWYMEGYGFPPHVHREGSDGWWPTEDVGLLDEAGYLVLAGRMDECFKTPAGYLVNPAEIRRALGTHPGVNEVVVIPVPAPGGGAPSIGAVVQGRGPIDPTALLAVAGELLPSWLWPQVVVVREELPRLPGGKPDRAACAEMLAGARAGAGARPSGMADGR
jgi:acyl-CoA synthetase (AMP-forming)/AMP-acid ligase II